MFEIKKPQEDRSGEDYQQRNFYSLDTMIELESLDSPISTMLEYWLELKNGATTAPKADSFRFNKLWEMKIPQNTTIIDCSVKNPYNFKISRHAYDTANRKWIFGARITGQHIGLISCPMISKALQADYQYAKKYRNPKTLLYTRTRQYINGVYRDFMRLVLSFASASGDISMLLAVTRLRTPVINGSNFVPDIQNIG
jgi:hypothetical protein